LEVNDANAKLYFNRGVLKVILTQNAAGCQDLQKTAAMGVFAATIELEKSCK
jgi:hypothetical protein